MSDGGMCLKEVIKLLRAVFPSSCIVLALTIVSGLVLFLPESTLTRLGINEGIQRCHPVIASVFWVLVTLWGLAIIRKICELIKVQIKALSWEQRQWKELEQMELSQFFTLVRLLKRPNKTIHLPPDTGMTDYLVNHGFIYQLSYYIGARLNGGLIELQYGPSEWLLKAYKSERFQRILAEKYKILCPEEERTPGTTTT